MSREERIRRKALELGFSMAGVAEPEVDQAHLPFYREWVRRGLHGEMEYLARPEGVERRGDLRRTLDSVRSVVVVAHEYFQGDAEAGDAASGDAVSGHGSTGEPTAELSTGIIARYARGADYHRVVKKKLRALARWIEEEMEPDLEARAYVDTGPILERELGRRAGLGWFGRNTMLIHPRRGSYFFLGVLLTDLELEPSSPFEADHCGSCRACLDACPTGALLGRDEDGAPVMDARRCISYLTIEHRGATPRELRPLMGNRIYGCDICQEVCPFNIRFAQETTEPRYAARGPGELPYGVEALPGEEAVERGSAQPAPPGNPGGVSAGASPDGSPTDGTLAAGSRADVSAETSGVGNPAHPGTEAPSLVELMKVALDEASWESFSRGSAIRRAGRAGFARNVAVSLGNWGAPEAVPVLSSALLDSHPLVRGHAAWALGSVRSVESRRVLESALSSEDDLFVQQEIRFALENMSR